MCPICSGTNVRYMDRQQQSLDNGQQTMDNGQRITGNGQWTTDNSILDLKSQQAANNQHYYIYFKKHDKFYHMPVINICNYTMTTEFCLSAAIKD